MNAAGPTVCGAPAISQEILPGICALSAPLLRPAPDSGPAPRKRSNARAKIPRLYAIVNRIVRDGDLPRAGTAKSGSASAAGSTCTRRSESPACTAQVRGSPAPHRLKLQLHPVTASASANPTLQCLRRWGGACIPPRSAPGPRCAAARWPSVPSPSRHALSALNRMSAESPATVCPPAPSRNACEFRHHQLAASSAGRAHSSARALHTHAQRIGVQQVAGWSAPGRISLPSEPLVSIGTTSTASSPGPTRSPNNRRRIDKVRRSNSSSARAAPAVPPP